MMSVIACDASDPEIFDPRFDEPGLSGWKKDLRGYSATWARADGLAQIEPFHLLYSVAVFRAETLAKLGIAYDVIERLVLVESRPLRSAVKFDGLIGWSDRSNEVLEAAAQIALARGDRRPLGEHLLVALLEYEGCPIVRRILIDVLRLDAGKVRQVLFPEQAP